jgi:Mrp family chromosome partitioning ATPase
VPTDLSIPRFACDLCSEIYPSLPAAVACEAAGPPPAALPSGTWVLDGGYATDWDEHTAGGLRLERIIGHRVCSSLSGGPHYLDYDVDGAAYGGEYTSWNLHPHQPGVLNVTQAIRLNALHDDRLDTVLHDPGRAEELSAVLASFGVQVAGGDLAEAAATFYVAFDFAGGDRFDRDHRVLAPLPVETRRQLGELVAVAGADASQSTDLPAFLGLDPDAFWRAVHTIAADRFVGNRARARAWTHTHTQAELVAVCAEFGRRWLAGDNVRLPTALLTARGGGRRGRPTTRQRAAMRVLEVDEPTVSAAVRAITAGLSEGVAMDRNGRLFDVPYVLAVASGKGGAGKTTVAASLAFAAQQAGLRAAVLDLDFHGPSLTALLSLPALGVTEQGRIVPHELAGGVRALSLGQLLEPTAPVEWRGAAVEGFLLFLGARVALDDVDLVVLDLPPGTGEVERAAVEHVRPDAVLLVTTGSSLSHADCRRAAAFFHNSRVPLLGVVENLSRRLVTVPGEPTSRCGFSAPTATPSASRPSWPRPSASCRTWGACRSKLTRGGWRPVRNSPRRSSSCSERPRRRSAGGLGDQPVHCRRLARGAASPCLPVRRVRRLRRRRQPVTCRASRPMPAVGRTRCG